MGEVYRAEVERKKILIMPLFICSKCGCVENTATSDYWPVIHKIFPIEYDASIKEFEGKPLCSECGRLIFDSKGENPRMIPGKWHGKFPKRQATDAEKRMVDRNGRF